MGMHEHDDAAEAHYWVMAQLCEPKYEAERKYLNAEMAYVKRALTKRKRVSLPVWGFFGHGDWRRYAHQLEQYGEHLAKYQREVEAGMLPVKFAIYNSAELPDTGIHVKISVKHGKINEGKQAPARPERLDSSGKPWKIKFPWSRSFKRSGIKVTAHGVNAQFSQLGAHDGATLVNQILHVQCGGQTEVLYQISSRNVPHEKGEVELDLESPAQAAQRPASST